MAATTVRSATAHSGIHQRRQCEPAWGLGVVCRTGYLSRRRSYATAQSMACSTTPAPGTSPAPTTRRAARDLWTYDPKVPREWGRYACCEPVARGLAFWNGKVIIATLDGRLIGTERERTARLLWTAQYLRQGHGPTPSPARRAFSMARWSSAMVAQIWAYAASSVPGTPTPASSCWKFYLVPGDPSKGPDGAASDSVMAMATKTWTWRMVEMGRRRYGLGFHQLRPGSRAWSTSAHR